MFCGIVDHVGVLENIEKKSKGILLRIHSQFNDFNVGESIAIDGTCLTVTAFQNNSFDCELSPETLNITIAQHYQPGQLLNLERAMRLGDRIGGHFVTGHVDEVIVVRNKIQHDQFIEFYFSGFSSEKIAYLIPKGSVTINGVSLTINVVENNYFSVMLISHTLACTNLSKLEVNDRVNVEWDYLAKIVVESSRHRRNVHILRIFREKFRSAAHVLFYTLRCAFNFSRKLR